jgi:hypothetical protein
VTRALLAGAGAAALFVVLAAANSGGYRFGVSDQAYYIPAIQQQLDDDLFPRDQPLLDAQSHLMTSDELMAGVVRTTGASLPAVAAGFYLLSLLVLLGAAVAFGRGLHFSWWAVAAFGILLTLRHRITKTGANSLEGYMHPRQLAFGLGVAALACVLRNRLLPAAACVAAAGLLHPTTALWFGLVVAVGAFVQRPAWRSSLAVGAGVIAAASVWAVTLGPMAARVVTMDAQWLQVLAEKDYLFPTDWPPDAWLINLAYPVLIWFTWRARQTRGLAVSGEPALVWGCLALTALFLVSIPLTAMELALAVQLQITRVFWVMDFVALACIAWWMTRHARFAVAIVAVLAAASAARGYYLLEVLQPERQLARVELPPTAWIDAMTWLQTQPADWHVLADPGHAWKYGVSVRLAATRDTVLESVKDSAISLYDRDIAARVLARTRDLIDFDLMTVTRVRALDASYDLDALVVERDHLLDLPVLYRNDQFVIYDLR